MFTDIGKKIKIYARVAFWVASVSGVILGFLLLTDAYGVEEVIDGVGLNDDLKYLFGLLKDVMMTKKKITASKERAVDYPVIYQALERLEALEDLLRIYEVQQYVYYELAFVSNFDYYTGIIFAGYTFGIYYYERKLFR